MDDGGGMRAGCIRIKFSSPRRIMNRWFSSQGKKKKSMAEGWVRDCDSVRVINFSEDGDGVGEFSDSPPRTIDSGLVRDEELKRREFLFTIGVSCYLLHLIATGREEIRKIVELRNDLDKFLECKNDELRRKQQELRNDIDKFLEHHHDELRQKQTKYLFGKQEQSETTSDVVDGPESSTDHYYSPQFLETSLTIGHEGSLKHYGGDEDLGGEMDQLEAELQAEFELLQIGQDQEGKCSNLQDISEKSEDSQGLRLRQMYSGPVDEQQGVCPYELERKLHEVMEARQEEKIKELEIALEDAKQRLHVKEAQVSWWKDTAYIVSEHIPESSRTTSNSQTHRYPLSR